MNCRHSFSPSETSCGVHPYIKRLKAGLAAEKTIGLELVPLR
jgi:hypothetical protein